MCWVVMAEPVASKRATIVLSCVVSIYHLCRWVHIYIFIHLLLKFFGHHLILRVLASECEDLDDGGGRGGWKKGKVEDDWIYGFR